MSISSIHAHEFYKQIAKDKKVWTIKDSGGFPAPKNSEGKRAQPFWSSITRVQKIIINVSAYTNFEPYEITWECFRDKWLPGLKKDGILIGINWSGNKAKGYDIDADNAKFAIEIQINNIK
jgi:hypothetical protein